MKILMFYDFFYYIFLAKTRKKKKFKMVIQSLDLSQLKFD